MCQGTNLLNVANLNENSVVRITTIFYELLQGSQNMAWGRNLGYCLFCRNTVLLEHSQTCSFTHCPWLLSAYNSSTEELQEQQGLEQLLPGLHESLLLLSYSEGLVRKKLNRHKVTITDKTNTVLFEWKLNKLIKRLYKVLPAF